MEQVKFKNDLPKDVLAEKLTKYTARLSAIRRELVGIDIKDMTQAERCIWEIINQKY